MPRVETCSRARRRPRQFLGDPRGIAATEFALVLPLALTVLFGAFAVGEAVAISRKVTIATRTVADLISQNVSVSNAYVSTVLKASSAIAAPFPRSDMAIVVSEVSTNASGKARVVWSKALNGAPLAAGQTVTLPAAMVQPNSSLIWGQVNYTYTPPIGYELTGQIPISDQIFMSPRLSKSIDLTN
ncbi:MAG: pilus assembly protein [Methylocystis sp.]|nr:pilus assembly protein [Methylocystis sp.]